MTDRTPDLDEASSNKGESQKKKTSLVVPPVKALSLMLVTVVFASMLGSISTFCELLCHFQLQYGFELLVFLILLALFKQKPHVIVVALALLLNLALVLPLYRNQGLTAAPGDKYIRVVTANVNSKNQNYDAMLNVLSTSGADVILIQELSPSINDHLQKNLKSHPYNFVLPQTDNFGIGIYSKYELLDRKVESFSGAKVPTLVADVDVNGRRIRIINTHPVPPASNQLSDWRNEQLNALADFVGKTDTPVILAGDLNSTCWSPFFQGLLGKGRLSDSELGFGVQPTWPTQMPILMIPLDHVLYKGPFEVESRKLLPTLGSDHLPVCVELRFTGRP